MEKPICIQMRNMVLLDSYKIREELDKIKQESEDDITNKITNTFTDFTIEPIINLIEGINCESIKFKLCKSGKISIHWQSNILQKQHFYCNQIKGFQHRTLLGFHKISNKKYKYKATINQFYLIGNKCFLKTTGYQTNYIINVVINNAISSKTRNALIKKYCQYFKFAIARNTLTIPIEYISKDSRITDKTGKIQAFCKYIDFVNSLIPLNISYVFIS